MSKTLKFGIALLVILCLLFLVLTFVDLPTLFAKIRSFKLDDLTFQPEVGDPDLSTAVQEALVSASGDWQGFSYQIDYLEVQDDGQMAMVWLAATDQETGDFLGREPELALAELNEKGNWVVLLDGEEKFDDALAKYQDTGESKEGDLTCVGKPKSENVYGGYYLPWAEGLTKRLTWSVSHTSCYPTYYCTHAFDFADGTMFPLVAAKGGTVYHWKDTCANGDSNCTNSITLEDRSTTPWTYQIYMHIAEGSIPDNLKKAGTPILQGQYIADVDDTGYSTGHHVHFMVVARTTMYISTKGYVFGMAEDVTFRDVTINWDKVTQGGRPRLAYEAASYGGEGQTYYTSGNAPANPPTGGLISPEMEDYVTNSTLTVSGWGKDDVGVTKYEILAKVDSEWVTVKEVGPGNNFSTTLDLCTSDIPDGPVELALRVWDYEGNPSSILSVRKIIKDTECGTVGTDPTVNLVRQLGSYILPNGGSVTAQVAEGSTGSDIVSVEFWLSAYNWFVNDWVNLGQDTDGSDGWQAPINTIPLAQGSKYTVVVVATDQSGHQGVDVDYNAIVDKTPPWLEMTALTTPHEGDHYSLDWRAVDTISGLEKFDLAVKVDGGSWQMLDFNISPSVWEYECDVPGAGFIEFRLRAFDLAGNIAINNISTAQAGYENIYTFPLFSD